MPVDWKKYPTNWREIRTRIIAISGGQCMCMGACGLHRTNPGPRRCIELNGQPAKWAKGLVVLTVAHLDHTPAHCSDDNLIALCQRCHLRYDQAHHQANARVTRRNKKATGDLFT